MPLPRQQIRSLLVWVAGAALATACLTAPDAAHLTGGTAAALLVAYCYSHARHYPMVRVSLGFLLGAFLSDAIWSTVVFKQCTSRFSMLDDDVWIGGFAAVVLLGLFHTTRRERSRVLCDEPRASGR